MECSRPRGSLVGDVRRSEEEDKERETSFSSLKIKKTEEEGGDGIEETVVGNVDRRRSCVHVFFGVQRHRGQKTERNEARRTRPSNEKYRLQILLVSRGRTTRGTK